MLASNHHGGIAVGEYWVSEKLDGVRARWDGRRLLTRGGHVIASPAGFTAGWPALAMDGELWLGRGRFETASGLVRARRPHAPDWRRMRFMVFDLPGQRTTFDARIVRMRSLLQGTRPPTLRMVPQVRVRDAAVLDAMLEIIVARGGEGLVLHHGNARYRYGRSEALLKYKPHDDAEARVIGYSPGRGKYAGKLGALLVQRADGLRFRLGSGLSDAQRARPPRIGSHVTYRYNGLTDAGVPRFARFLRVRHDPPPPDPHPAGPAP